MNLLLAQLARAASRAHEPGFRLAPVNCRVSSPNTAQSARGRVLPRRAHRAVMARLEEFSAQRRKAQDDLELAARSS